MEHPKILFIRYSSVKNIIKDRKPNHTNQTKSPLRLPINPISIIKTMTDSAPRPFPWQELVASTPKIDAL